MFSLASIALIGPDGAGKTTVTRMLAQSFAPRLKCLYMGINIASSNVALPTSRMVEYVKRLLAGNRGAGQAREEFSQGRENRKGKLWASARLANRFAEEWYRQLLSWSYQVRGYAVLYDRHFLFDFSLDTDGGRAPLSERTHRWLLTYFYPRPDLVIYLDAPAEVLYARKHESTVEDLNCRRKSYIRLGKETANFVQIDATQPLEAVYNEAANHVARLVDKGYGTPGIPRGAD